MDKSVRKILVAALFVAAFAAVLGGCDQSPNTSGDPKYGYGNGGDSATPGEAGRKPAATTEPGH